MKRLMPALGLLVTSCVGFADNLAQNHLSYTDVQLCTNAYNELWFSFETIKSDMRNSPPADQVPVFTAAFTPVLAPDFQFSIFNLPLPPDYTTISPPIQVTGVSDLANVAAYGIGNYGEHHVATPFSVKEISSSLINLTHVYRMTTRDVDYTRDAAVEGGCTVYISQKEAVCTVTSTAALNFKRVAVLNSIVDHVVSAYTIPAPQCASWISAPFTSYVQ
ncbi:hypothetical protein [Legionella sp. PC997]|uniref:hypothetical protein n=1 Tax=Legionella sp. PC997 TaxID=2755562 RepID=UPI0018628A08|nr:hypothetical protein [Legionella sp. PC997]QMT59726.1 hypothetical protein HBNCFIEN_01093 [Legionella sp. PC997]